MAGPTVGVLVNYLVQLLDGEAKLLIGVHKEVEKIKDELKSIQCFLENADERAETHKDVRIWVKQVRRVAYQIEDVFDEYTMHLAADQRPHHQKRRFFINFFHRVTCFIIKVKPRRRIASQVQEIKVSIKDIQDRAARYQFSSAEQGNNEWLDPRDRKSTRLNSSH